MQKKQMSIFFCSLLLLMLVACKGKMSEEDMFIKVFDIDVKKSDIELIQTYSDYSGAPYEGKALYIIIFSEDINVLTSDWNAYPLPDDIFNFLYEDEVTPSISSEIGLPYIEKGKWKYVDRGSSKFDEPSTYNFSLCMFDEINNMVYYFKIDT